MVYRQLLCHVRLTRSLSRLTAWSRVLLEKLTGSQLVKKFPAFYGTQRFIIAFRRAGHLSLSWARSVQSMPYHLRLCFPNDLIPSGFPTKTLYKPLLSPIRPACPAHLILLDLITRQHRSLTSSLCSFFHSPVTSYLLSPNIPLNALFSNTLCSLSVSDQVSHP